MTHAIGVLIRARLLIARNTFWRGKISRKIGVLVLLALVAFGAYGLYWFMSATVRFLTSQPFFRTLELAAKQDPLLGPALLGYGQGMGYGASFFVAATLVLALLPLLPAGLGALLVMAVVRVIPARRAREIVSVIGGLFGASWYIVNQFAPEVAPRIANVRTLESLRRLDVPLLPSAWAGRALVAAGQRDWLTLLAYGGLFTVLSRAVYAGCLLLAERLYYAGWS